MDINMNPRCPECGGRDTRFDWDRYFWTGRDRFNKGERTQELYDEIMGISL